MLELELKGQQLSLLAEKAMIWQDKACLILADLHMGKITHFRKSGLPLPRQAELENYERLSTILLNHKIDRVLILGDLFHSTMNSEWDIFSRFLSEFSHISFELVHGNHDILPGEAYTHDNFTLLGERYTEGPFLFSHKQESEATGYNIYGHIHPGIRLEGKGRQSLRLPCFAFGENEAILPAFGTFTGLHCLNPGYSDKIFVISGYSVMEVK